MQNKLEIFNDFDKMIQHQIILELQKKIMEIHYKLEVNVLIYDLVDETN